MPAAGVRRVESVQEPQHTARASTDSDAECNLGRFLSEIHMVTYDLFEDACFITIPGICAVALQLSTPTKDRLPGPGHLHQ
jgi:hypothetical protein